MSVGKRLFAYAGIDVIAALLGLITSPITTRLLTVDQYGAVSYLAAVWAPFLVARYAGVDSSYIFFKARREVDQRVLIVASTKVIGLATILVIGVFVGFVWATDFFADIRVIGKYEFLLFVLGLLPIALVDWFLLLLRFAHQATIFAKIAIVQKVTVIVLALPAMYLVDQEMRLIAYFFVAAVIPFLSFIYALKLINGTSLKPFDWPRGDTGMIRELLSYGLYLIPGTVLYALIAVADKLLVGAFDGVDGVALLALAIALSAPITLMKKWVSLTFNPLFTDWVRDLSKDEYSLNHDAVLKCLCSIFFPLLLVITLWAAPVVDLLYTEAYSGSALMVPLVSYAGTLAVLTLVAVSTVLITQKKSTTLKINLAGLAFNVALSVYLIPRLGPVGAVFGTILAEVIILASWAYLGAVYYRNLMVGWSEVLPVTALVSVLVLPGAYHFAGDVGWVERLTSTAVIVVLSFFYLRHNADSFNRVRQFL